jgi:hypothetical protein
MEILITVIGIKIKCMVKEFLNIMMKEEKCRKKMLDIRITFKYENLEDLFYI